jgi:hypothetical protein
MKLNIVNVTNICNSVALVLERTLLTERPPHIGEVTANVSADRGCRVVNATDPYGCFLGFLDQSRYYSFHRNIYSELPL